MYAQFDTPRMETALIFNNILCIIHLQGIAGCGNLQERKQIIPQASNAGFFSGIVNFKKYRIERNYHQPADRKPY